MPHNLSRKIMGLGGFLFFLPGMGLGVRAPAPPEPESFEDEAATPSERVSELLAAIQREAALVSRHAARLESLGRNSEISWRSHAEQLNLVKLHINNVGVRTDELQALHDQAPPWQQLAITEVTSHALAVAGNTQAAMDHLNDNHQRLFLPEYRDRLASIADHSADLKQSLDKFLDYEKTRQKFQQLQSELEVTDG